jgi:hypothetical protein
MLGEEVCTWILCLTIALFVGCGGKTNGGAGNPDASMNVADASVDAAVPMACDASSAPSCTGLGAPPCDWSAAMSKYCGVSSGSGPLWRCGSYTAVEFFGVDVADYYFYDAAGGLVGKVYISYSGYSTCTAYDESFVPPPPHDPMAIDELLPGCVPLSTPCLEDAASDARAR